MLNGTELYGAEAGREADIPTSSVSMEKYGVMVILVPVVLAHTPVRGRVQQYTLCMYAFNQQLYCASAYLP